MSDVITNFAIIQIVQWGLNILTKFIVRSVLCGILVGGDMYVSATTKCLGFKSFISLLACEKLRLVSIGQ